MSDVKKILMTGFAKDRHFGKKSGAVTRIVDHTPEEFVRIVNNMLREDKVDYEISSDSEVEQKCWVRQGDFEFSRLITFDNFTDVKATVIPITTEIIPFMRSGYFSRNDEELAVLSEWVEFPSRIERPLAESITVILYTKSQLIKETLDIKEETDKVNDQINDLKKVLIELAKIGKEKNNCVKAQDYEKASQARGREKEILKSVIDGGLFGLDEESSVGKVFGLVDLFSDEEDGWAVVAVLAHNGSDIEPMKPITMMRNALGTSEGGNGVKIDREKYKESVDFWNKHISVK